MAFIRERQRDILAELGGGCIAPIGAYAVVQGEYVDTLHTRAESRGEPSAPTVEYLEAHGLLPDDHDVTQADIEAVIDA